MEEDTLNDIEFFFFNLLFSGPGDKATGMKHRYFFIPLIIDILA